MFEIKLFDLSLSNLSEFGLLHSASRSEVEERPGRIEVLEVVLGVERLEVTDNR